MACSEIEGNWIVGVLVDGSDNVELDPILRISKPSSKLIGRFDGAGEIDFEIDCDDSGSKTKIEFTRIHGGTTTEYKGKVAAFGTRAKVGIIKGTFTRHKVGVEGRKETTNGDWETEKPT